MAPVICLTALQTPVCLTNRCHWVRVQYITTDRTLNIQDLWLPACVVVSCSVNALAFFVPRPLDEWCEDDGSVGDCLHACE